MVRKGEEESWSFLLRIRTLQEILVDGTDGFSSGRTFGAGRCRANVKTDYLLLYLISFHLFMGCLAQYSMQLGLELSSNLREREIKQRSYKEIIIELCS